MESSQPLVKEVKGISQNQSQLKSKCKRQDEICYKMQICGKREHESVFIEEQASQRYGREPWLKIIKRFAK